MPIGCLVSELFFPYSDSSLVALPIRDLQSLISVRKKVLYLELPIIGNKS